MEIAAKTKFNIGETAFIPLVEKVVSTKITEAVYSARQQYNEEGNIELDTRELYKVDRFPEGVYAAHQLFKTEEEAKPRQLLINAEIVSIRATDPELADKLAKAINTQKPRQNHKQKRHEG